MSNLTEWDQAFKEYGREVRKLVEQLAAYYDNMGAFEASLNNNWFKGLSLHGRIPVQPIRRLSRQVYRSQQKSNSEESA